jgi:LysR family transcriptional activator of nhaA
LDRLNFNHLYYFYIVAKEGSIKGAAHKLHVSQPTISDQIKLLEEYFHCPLFERKNRSLVLTKEGALALKYAQQVFDLSKELTSQLRNDLKRPKKTLDIGITYSLSHYFLYDWIMPLFSQENVKVNIQEGERHLLLAELEEDNIDILFTNTNDGLSTHLSSYRVGVNKTFAIAHKKYKRKNIAFPAILNEIPFLNYTKESLLKYEIELFFTKNGLSPKQIGEGDDINLFEMVTKEGMAFSIVPEVAKNRLCKDNDVVVLGELEELQTFVWGIVKNSYEGVGLKLFHSNKK